LSGVIRPRARFRLPPALAFAVAPGPHGDGVIVHPGAGVEVLGRSREYVIQLAAFFFATVARDRLPFSVVASIGPVVAVEGARRRPAWGSAG
jgi:hypothetical protein